MAARRAASLLVALVLALALSPALAEGSKGSEEEERCDAATGQGCSEHFSPDPLPVEVHGNLSGNATTRQKPQELGPVRVGVLLAMVGAAFFWISATIKFAVDGSLPARLVMWGLLPEAYAAISVRAVSHLLRLKSGETPVIVLRSCVTDAAAVELAEAVRKYGKAADLQVLELPHNPKLGEAGLRALVEVAAEKALNLQEFDFGYNPQLRDEGMSLLLPLLEPKASKINTLKLAGCGLTAGFLGQLAKQAARCKLRTLDLSCNNLAGLGEELEGLCEAPVLEELTLACCSLGPKDVAVLAEQLPYTSIRTLQLGWNGFGSEGLLALVEHLPDSRVDELCLECNDIEVDALDALGVAWTKRPFSRVRLNGNKIPQEKVVAFVKTLRTIHS